jgi:hypothetical protein
MAGTQHLNLMQQMYYNGYYKVHFAKVQHLFQADGMVNSWSCPLRNHSKSGVLLMLTALCVYNNCNRQGIWQDCTFTTNLHRGWIALNWTTTAGHLYKD